MFRCPKCGRTDRLAVLVSVWAKVDIEDEGENFQTEIPNSHHPDIPDTDLEFNDTSMMRCGACEHEAKSEDFAIEIPDAKEWDDGTINCSLCGEPCSAKLAHVHQGKFVGDECCWDERLRGSE
jgi:transcription elongation factor Elf1